MRRKEGIFPPDVSLLHMSKQLMEKVFTVPGPPLPAAAAQEAPNHLLLWSPGTAPLNPQTILAIGF